MPRVHDLLSEKGNEVWSIEPSRSVYQAIKMMSLKQVGALTVVDDRGVLVGIVSERDYARKVILQGRSSQETPVSEIMTREVITTHESTTVEECMAIMNERRVRHLPIVSDDQLVGMISVGDAVKAILKEQEFKIDQLERYARG